MSFFKAYDMRGEYGKDFDLDTIYRIGRWLPVVLKSQRVLVGRDARLSSAAIRDALCRGLSESGCSVDDLGLATTPMVYFFTAQAGYDASVQITASHNPANHNGLKISRAGALPLGAQSGGAELERHVQTRTLPPASRLAGGYRSIDLRQQYIQWLLAFKRDLGGLKLAVDCSDGVAGLVIRDLLGDAPIYLNEQPDGHFPHHTPNPLEAASREQLTAMVKARQLDIGVIFDGDADRVMFVDERGEFVQPDYLIPLIARWFLKKEPGATIIHDIRTSRGVVEALKADGARTVMGKVGHSFAKLLMRETSAVCGGELAGHYYFRDFFCCDSGELAALLVLSAVAEARRQGILFSEMIAPIRRYANSGELNYKIADQGGAIAAVSAVLRSWGPPQAYFDFDGMRWEYAEGWISLRKSNTEPYLRLIIETIDYTLLTKWRAVLDETLQPFGLVSRG